MGAFVTAMTLKNIALTIARPNLRVNPSSVGEYCSKTLSVSIGINRGFISSALMYGLLLPISYH
jgi:hypothetical protein